MPNLCTLPGASGLFLLLSACFANAKDPVQECPVQTRTTEIHFKSRDGHEMFGKLTLPASGSPRAIVISVQTAEGATVDQKRRKGRDETFNYYDLYREKLPAMKVGFFSYEGRGIRMGDKPPRFEKVDWDVYNTSTLENKVSDALSAIEVIQKQSGLESTPIWLMGASESTLLAAETASRAPKCVAGLVLYGVLATNMRENFKYIMSDGAFLNYRIYFDTDEDGKISKEEFETDAKKYRVNVLKNAPFMAIDRNGDGWFAVEDMRILTKLYLEAIDSENFEVLQRWAKTSAAVVVPKDWFKDHFAHKPIWAFLSTLDIPVGCFHGALDTNTPIAAVRKLEEEAKKAGKSKMQFSYFDNLDHTLNVGEYFTRGKLPAGHEAIFAFIKTHVDGVR